MERQTRQHGDDLSIRINPELREAINHLAAEQDRSLSWVVREAIAQYIREHDGGQDVKAVS